MCLEQITGKDDFDKLTRLSDQARFDLKNQLNREPQLNEIMDHLESKGLIPPVNCEVDV
ncbi:hypothetical protein [Leptospira meyeri]|uniref:hypothetical protein n=1 Tax=Leptospira meyeri TaxID=29508 RepID=UPI0014383547|nr:hypothetical protein [Leptospira meyeri]